MSDTILCNMQQMKKIVISEASYFLYEKIGFQMREKKIMQG